MSTITVEPLESHPPSVDSYSIEVAQEAESKTNFILPDPCPNYDIKTSTLIDFSSFQIHKKDFSSFRFYGHIKLTTDYGREFFLFKREINDPMLVRFNHSNNNNTFVLPESKLSNPHWLPKFFWLELYLVDENQTVILVNEEFLLDFCHKVSYDTKQKIVCDLGRYGVFTITYTIYRSAALAVFTYDIFEPKYEFSKHGTDVCVSGTISAVEGQRQLWYKSQEFESATLSTNHINPFPAVAVPVYSHLKVIVDLEVDGQHIFCDDDSSIFKPTVAPLRTDIVRGKWCISVALDWIPAFQLFDDDVFVGDLISYDTYYLISEHYVERSQQMRTTNLPSSDSYDDLFEGDCISHDEYLKSDATSESEHNAETYIMRSQQMRTTNPPSDTYDDPYDFLFKEAFERLSTSQNDATSESEHNAETYIERSQQMRTTNPSDGYDDLFEGDLISHDEFLKNDATLESEHNAETYIVRSSQQMSNCPVHFARYLGEVFSISISSFDHRELSLHILGTIKLNDYLIFEKNENNIEVIKQHHLLSLLTPECCYTGFDNNGFRIYFDLKDAHGDEFCKGCVMLNVYERFRWHDRRICSVIIGKLGYVSVHYAIFYTAIQAKLNVRFLSSCCSSFKVYGKIHARYSTYRYSTHYERKYFRIMLFKKQKADSLNICAGEFDQTSHSFSSDIPLSKDVVAVPCDDASLILEVELHCCLHVVGGESDCTIKGELIFDPRKSAMLCTKKIEGQNPLEVEVEVKWS